MKTTEKIWHDENSEPPKNYIWAKNGKLFKYINGQWKEISKNNSGCDCPGVMFVHGTTGLGGPGTFTPNTGEPSWNDARAHVENGGILYIAISNGPTVVEIAYSGFVSIFSNKALVFGDTYSPNNPSANVFMWTYVPEPDFTVSIDYDSPDAIQGNKRFWFTQLDQSTVGDADACQLLIHYTESDESCLLVKVDDGEFTYGNDGLVKRETVLEDYPTLTIPEGVEYIVIYRGEPS